MEEIEISQRIRNNIMVGLPDNMLGLKEGFTINGRPFDLLTGDPHIDIICSRPQMVHIEVIDLRSRTLISTKYMVYKEYDTISSWLVEVANLTSLDNYVWSIRPSHSSQLAHQSGNSQSTLELGNNAQGLLEHDIESILCEELERKGLSFERQVRTRVGIADVVTADTIFEVKKSLTRTILFHAMGQLYTYKGVINSEAKLIVCFAEVDRKEYRKLEKIAVSAQVGLKHINSRKSRNR